MKKKILITVLLVALTSLILAESVTIVQMIQVENAISEGSQDTVRNMMVDSYELMLEQDEAYMMQLANSRALIADERFVDIERTAVNLAESAKSILENGDLYSETKLKERTERDMGSYVVVTSFASEEMYEDEALIRKRNRLNNLQGQLRGLKTTFPNLGAAYVGTEDGIYIGSEKMRADYFGRLGDKLVFDPRERPWYKLAKETGDVAFTEIFEDADSGRLSVSCGVPIVINGKLAGVAGIGMFVDDLEDAIRQFAIGEDGFSCLVDDDGYVLFTGKEIGEIEIEEEENRVSLAECDNEDLAQGISALLRGESFPFVAMLDDVNYVFTSAPMETLGWYYLAILPMDEVTHSSDMLMQTMMEQSEQLNESIRGIMRSTIIWILLTFVVAILLAFLLSHLNSVRLVRPIILLTSKVQEIQGDNLDFDLKLETKDEIQTLAESFGNLTERMKQYIKDITAITAEKERIGAELTVATQIQSDLLPSIFPPFPDRKEFDLYAAMDPAKEVGGDFYDFFMLDDDHLVCVIADVSGKGVPAALFMVVSKTLMKNQAQNEPSPAKILEVVNNELCANNKAAMFVTAWIGILEISTGKMVCSNAGHEYPAIRGTEGEFSLLKDDHGLVLAAMEDVTYTDYELTLPENGTIFVYTDGVPEATNSADELYDLDRMVNALNIEPDADPKRLMEIVRKDIDEFVGDADQFDDLTMLCLKRRKKE